MIQAERPRGQVEGWFPKWSRILLTGTLVLLASGCGNLTAGGFGEAETFVTGDGSPNGTMAAQSTPSVAPSHAPPAQEPPALSSPSGVIASQVGQLISGTVTVRLRVDLIPMQGAPVSISGGIREVTVGIAEVMSANLGAVSIPSGSYQGVRVTFLEVGAMIQTEVVPGIPVLEEVVVDLGSASELVVDRTDPFTVEEDRRVEVEVDLRARGWVLLGSPGVLRVVPASTFTNALQILVNLP